jgi:hypothetical protein
MRHIILMAVLLGAQMSAVGQVGTNNPQPIGPQVIKMEPIQVTDPATISKKDMPEATMAVIPPKTNGKCENGRLFFGSGSIIKSVSLKAGPAGISVIAQKSMQFDSPDDLSPPFEVYDNHLVATKDGDLIYTVLAVIWQDNIRHKDWWSQTFENTLKGKNVKGGRGAIFVFRSTNCGDTWERMPTIDAAKLTVAGEEGFCAWPRINKALHTAEAGGWDGHFLYADHFNGNIYLTTPCLSAKGDLGLVLMANPQLTEWKVILEVKDAAFWRVPITTLSDGSVVIAYPNSSLNKAFVGLSAEPAGPFDEKELAALSFPEDIVSRAGLPDWLYVYPTLARITADKGNKEGYQSATWFNSGGDITYNIERHTHGATLNATTISGAKKGNSVLQGTFVDSTGPKALDGDSPSIFFWLEQVGKSKFQVRFLPFIGGIAMANPEAISNVFSTFTGDYISGTSYRTATGLWKFYLSWNQSGSLQFAEVTIKVPESLPTVVPSFAIKRVRPSFKFEPIGAELKQTAKRPVIDSSRVGLTKPTGP